MHLGGRDEEPRGSFRIRRMPNCLRQAFVAGLLFVPPVAGGQLGNRDSQRLHGVCGSEINDPVQDESNRHQQAGTQRPPGEATEALIDQALEESPIASRCSSIRRTADPPRAHDRLLLQGASRVPIGQALP